MSIINIISRTLESCKIIKLVRAIRVRIKMRMMIMKMVQIKKQSGKIKIKIRIAQRKNKIN